MNTLENTNGAMIYWLHGQTIGIILYVQISRLFKYEVNFLGQRNQE
jgi:hypothetical protein